MSSSTIVITDSDLPADAAIETLQNAGHTVRLEQCRTSDDVVAAAKDADALIVQWARITREVLSALPDVRVISRLGIGYDMIDVGAANDLGVAVTNTPSYCIEEVAAHTVAMIMATTRGLIGYDAQVHAGRWAAVDCGISARRPSATTIAVIGFGRIGSLAADHCKSLGFKVLVSDPMIDDSAVLKAGHRPVTFEEAMRAADIVTLHAPLTDQTRHMINRETLALSQRRPVIVNTCRGGLVDEDALIEALDTGQIAGAALDVFESEPLAGDSLLRQNPRAILTPHAAWYSSEALAELPVHAARNVVEFLASRPVPAIVNPEYRSGLASDLPA